MSETEAPPVPSRLRPYLKEIAERLSSGHAAVMVGAGFSRNTKPKGGTGPSFPDWSELGDRFYEKLHDKKPDSDSRYLNVLKLADEVEATFGRPVLNQILRDAIPSDDYEPSQLHIDLLDLPWSDVFTTNYDTLLERACRFVTSQRYDVVVNKEDLVYSEKPRIVKLHGSFPSEQPFIITEDDYRRYPDDFSPFVNTVRQSLLENTLCLIGFSGDDPNFLQWIGWIHDNLGRENSPQIYLVGLLGLSDSQKKLLERRNIVSVDLSEYQDVDEDPYKALELFLNYLKKENDKRLKWLEWPYDNDDNLLQPGKYEQDETVSKLLQTWKTQRLSYPGWVIVPEDCRYRLWLYTEKWLTYLSVGNDLPSLVDLEFAFELNWRMEKCLCPIHGEQVGFLESTLNRYMPFTDLKMPVESLPVTPEEMKERELDRHDIRDMCHYLLISMMRYYREEGFIEKWKDSCKKIQDDVPNLPPEHKERFHYEYVLFELFGLNLQELKKRIAEWQVNESLPFWEAKKASILAEIGQVDEAKRILENSLAEIRTKINLKPITTDYSLVSQESFIMFLLQYAQMSLAFGTDEWSKFEKLRNEFSKRWHTLRQYKCDPWNELKFFKSALNRPPMEKSIVTEKTEFDIGRVTRTRHLGNNKYYKDVMTAYNFLRFCEDVGIPFRIPRSTIEKDTVVEALPRVAEYSPYWATVCLVRIGDEKVVDRIFDRASLYRMETASIDSLIEHYLNILESAMEDIRSGDPIGHSNFGIALAKVIPEILSRLCCKCSTDTKRKLIDFLLEVYQSDYKQNYGGIQNLTKRLLDAFSVSQRFDLIPRLLDFPILSDIGGLGHEFKNPFQFLEMKRDLMIVKPAISNEKLDVLFEKALSDNIDARKWAMWTLFRLHSWNLLESQRMSQFTETLWSQLDGYGLPSQTDFQRRTFLDLPHPEEVDPVSSFKKYIYHEWSLIQGDRTEDTVHIDKNRLCIETINANIEWSSEDVNFIFDHLIEWWNEDRLYLIMEDTPSLFHVSIAEEFRDRLKYLADVFETVILPNFHLIKDENKEEMLRHLVDEFRNRGLPALRMEAACLDIFPEWKDDIFRRIEDGMIDADHRVVIESLRSIWNLVKRTKAKTDDKELTRVLNMLGEMVRWQKSRDLASTLSIIVGLLKDFDWAFSDGLERSTLVSLRRIANNTTIDIEAPALSEKLEVRQWAARSAYELFEHYTKRESPIPDVIKEWETICQSENEFAEVRNQWIRQDPE